MDDHIPSAHVDLLGADDVVLWWGRPHVRTYAKKGMWSSVMYGVLFALVVVVIEFQSETWLWHLVCLPYAGLIVYLLGGRVWFRAREARGTWYILTNKSVW